jgi:hypothetical protein
MLVITDITVVNTNDDRAYHAIYTSKAPYARMMSATAPYTHVKVTREDIQGQRFFHPTCGHVVIGWAAKAEKALQIPLEIFSRHHQEIADYKNQIHYLKQELAKYKKE